MLKKRSFQTEKEPISRQCKISNKTLTSHKNINLSPSRLEKDSEVSVTDIMEFDSIQSDDIQNTQHLGDTAGEQGFMTTGETDTTDNLKPTEDRFQCDDPFNPLPDDKF